MMSLGKVKVFSSILLTGLLVLLIYSFFSDFGLRDDEGFYLYYLKQGISEPTFTFFHTIGNLFGYIFSYQLLGFRLLNLILILHLHHRVILHYQLAQKHIHHLQVLIGLMEL